MKTLFFIISLVALVCAFNLETPQGYMTYQPPIQAETVAAPVEDIPAYCVGHTDICGALRAAGFNEDETRIMMAVAQGESGLRLDAIGDVSLQDGTWGPSVGVFQIRTLKRPPQGCRIYERLMESLEFQAACAKQVYDQQGFNAWTVYSKGIYKKYLK